MKQLLAFLASLFGAGKKKKPPVIIVPPMIVPEWRLNWPDRRPIGMVMLAEYIEPFIKGDRKWKLGGYYQFSKEALMKHADECIQHMTEMNAQGMIVWNIEGEEYWKPVSYIGDPRVLAPEMEPLADEFFAKFKGFKTGVCLRPTRYENARHYTVIDPRENLLQKAKYAYKRWGCTIFYVDSNIQPNEPPGYDITLGGGNVMSVDVFRLLAEEMPNCLFIPEHFNFDYFKYTAPYYSWNNKMAPVLSSEHKAILPNSFLVAATNSETPQVEEGVKQGNAMIFACWWNDPNNLRIKQAYIDAGQQSIKQ